MNRKINFAAGPAVLPVPVLEQIRDQIVDFNNAGLSLIESSHRTPLYEDVHQETIALVKELLSIPDNYKVLFLGGGATLQFGMIPTNFIKEGKPAEYVLTGSWGKKAADEAAKVGETIINWDGKPGKYTRLPESVTPSSNSAYLHITSNETVGGIQWKSFPKTGDVPLVADMSSDILSRTFDVKDFGLIYAGAQKNIGPAGVTMVIIRDDMVEAARDDMIAYLSYKIHADKNSMYNTPPVFPIWAVNLVMKWLKSQGGVSGIEKLNRKKASLLYDVIDNSNGFYTNPIEKESRSDMNVVFTTPDEETDKKFIAAATEEGMLNIKGHRSVGGCRASIYNAMPMENVEKLASFMEKFKSM